MRTIKCVQWVIAPLVIYMRMFESIGKGGSAHASSWSVEGRNQPRFCDWGRASAFRQVDRKTTQAGFLVFFIHFNTGLAHGFDAIVKRHEMLPVAQHGK